MPLTLDVQHISKQFGSVTALEDFSLTAKSGEFITLLGPSGCGKTTTLRLLAGFEQPTTGTIAVNGQLVADAKMSLAPEKRRVGMVFQDYALFPHLNVAKNVSFGLKGNTKEQHKRVKEILALVGLEGYENRMPYELSGGQQQRVALARALAPQPEIILLDEPFSNLDAALRGQVRGEIRSILHASGTTALFVTHDQEEAMSLSDKIAVIFMGKLHQVGSPFELYTRPHSKEVANFIGESNFLTVEAQGNHALSPLGKLRLLQAHQGRVDVLIRPEMLHLQPTDEGTPALIEWREYYGHDQRIGLRLEDGTKLIARADTQILYKVGQTIRVSVYAPLLAF